MCDDAGKQCAKSSTLISGCFGSNSGSAVYMLNLGWGPKVLVPHSSMWMITEFNLWDCGEAFFK